MRWVAVAAVGIVMSVAGCAIDGEPAPASNAPTSVPPATVTETVSASTQSTATAATALDSTPTRIVNLVAVDSVGRPINGFEINSPDPAGDIDCTYASVSRSTSTGRIYECGASAQSADVCWAVKSNTQLMCADTPWSRKLNVWTISSGSVPTSGAPSGAAQPWGLDLADGRECRIRVGGAWGGRSDGLVGAYSCTGGNDVVLQGADATSALDKSSSTWTVAVGPLGQGDANFPPPQKVAVRTAYFASAAG